MKDSYSLQFNALCIWLLAFLGLWGRDAIADVRPRVIVLTDITNEPDDQESLVRFLVYSNEYQVEGLIATTSTWLRNRTSIENIRACVAAYGKVRENLAKHASGFPHVEDLQAVIKEGRPEFGMSGVGAGKSTAGSKLIIDVVDREDSRPVWVAAWGGANCLAQALFDVRETRSAKELDEFISKIRVYTISDQDDSGPWMRQNFPNLSYVVSPGGERAGEYYQATWTGISGDAYYMNGPSYRLDLVSNDWLTKNVATNHGALGKMYPKWEYIMEGDTPSFMNLIGNGLNAHLNPGFGGWGGRYAFKKSYAEKAPIWTNSRDRVTTPDGQQHISSQATIWRWREAFQNDFAARMDWCVTEYANANHNPSAVVNGDSSTQVVRLSAMPGEMLHLDASKSSDPDGDKLSYRWFHYAEAERDPLNVRDFFEIPIENASKSRCTVVLPESFPRGVENAHIILDVVDGGTPNLHTYRRVIIQIQRD